MKIKSTSCSTCMGNFAVKLVKGFLVHKKAYLNCYRMSLTLQNGYSLNRTIKWLSSEDLM